MFILLMDTANCRIVCYLGNILYKFLNDYFDKLKTK